MTILETNERWSLEQRNEPKLTAGIALRLQRRAFDNSRHTSCLDAFGSGHVDVRERGKRLVGLETVAASSKFLEFAIPPSAVVRLRVSCGTTREADCSPSRMPVFSRSGAFIGVDDL